MTESVARVVIAFKDLEDHRMPLDRILRERGMFPKKRNVPQEEAHDISGRVGKNRIPSVG